MIYQPGVASTQDTFSHLWTVEEYQQLVKARLVGEDASVELVSGQIIRHRPRLGGRYNGSVQRLCAVLQRCMGERAKVRSRQPIVLSHNSELRPDIAILRGEAARYRYHNPTAETIVLLLEVADDLLTIDAALKARIYAEAGVQDYWVFDPRRVQLHVFREPTAGAYGQHQVFQVGQSVSLRHSADVVATLQPPTPLHFLTRQSQGRCRHSGMRLPLAITRHPVRTSPTHQEMSPAPSLPQPPALESTVQTDSLEPVYPSFEPQSVPSPRFLQPLPVAASGPETVVSGQAGRR